MKTKLIFAMCWLLLSAAFTANAYAQLAGSYRIIADGTGDYVSFQDAVEDLVLQGVNGATTFTVSPGNYVEQITIPHIDGSSETNTITFIGDDDENDSVLKFLPTINDARHVVLLNGAKHIRLQNLSIEVMTGATFGYAVLMMNQCENIRIINNRININIPSSTFSNNAGIVASSSQTFITSAGNNVNNLLIQGNKIVGGYNGISIVGSTADRLMGVRILNNDISNYYYHGVYLDNLLDPVVNHNLIVQRSIGTVTVWGSGIYSQNNSGVFTFGYNKMYNLGQYGIYLSNSPTPVGSQSLIINNSIGGGFRNSNNSCNGVYITASARIGIYFNNINMNGAQGRAINTLATATELSIQNNNFVFSGSGSGYAAYYAQGTVNSMIAHDYNNYFQGTSDKFVFYGSEKTNLAQLEAVNIPAGNDQNSHQTNPIYASVRNLSPFNIQLAGAGVTIAGITDDIMGSPRPIPPTIGAYEIEVHDNDLAAIHVSGRAIGWVNEPTEFVVTVYNSGAETQSNYEVRLMLADPPTQLASLIVSEPLLSGQAVSHPFTWEIGSAGNLSLYGVVVLGGDENSDNDRTPNFTIAALAPLSGFHVENFDNVTLPNLPLGWGKIVSNPTLTTAYVETTNINVPHSPPLHVRINNNNNPSSNIMLITPMLSNINMHNVKFWAKAALGDNVPSLIVGTLTNPFDASTFTPYQTIVAGTQLTSTNQEFVINFENYTGQDRFVAIKVGPTPNSWQHIVYIDSFTYIMRQELPPEPAMAVFPVGETVTFNNPVLSWLPSATGEAPTGYKVYLDTSNPPTTEVFDGLSTSYSTNNLIPGTTYFWKVVPYNTHGSTPVATVNTFTTIALGYLAESFENESFPPAGWQNPSGWVRETISQFHGIASAYKWVGSEYSLLVTPLLEIVQGSTLDFFARTAMNSNLLRIQVQYLDNNGFWQNIGNPVELVNAPFSSYSIDLSSLAGQQRQLAFAAYSLGNPGSVYIDYVRGPQIATTPAVSIDIVNNQVVLSWNEILGASSYQIFYSYDPLASFPQDWQGFDANGNPEIVVQGTSWSEPLLQGRKFYRVRASSGGASRGIRN